MKKFLIGLLAGVSGLAFMVAPAFADSYSANFESPTFTTTSISGQDGWSNAVNPAYDQGVVVNTYGYPSFGGQSFRISDAVTSGSFGDWVFAKPLTDAVGEVDSTNGAFSPGILQRHFEMQFDIASTQPAQQPGLHVSVSPDRGDGSRMSYLRFVDGPSGIDVFFDDVQGIINPANFVETQVGTGLSRAIAHHIKLTLDTLDGPSNDVVKVWIDGSLVKTGTSWENYYRYDSEALAEQNPRIVKTVIFQSRTGSGPVTNVADLGKGYLFDNLSLLSGPLEAKGNSLEANIYHVNSCTSDVVSNVPYKGHVTLITPAGKNDLILQGVIQGLLSKTQYFVWVRNLDANGGYSGKSLLSYPPLGYYELVSFVTNKIGTGNFHYLIPKANLPSGTYPIQVAINQANVGQIGCTVAATTRNYLNVVVGK